jgi:hypothetical protein
MFFACERSWFGRIADMSQMVTAALIRPVGWTVKRPTAFPTMISVSVPELFRMSQPVPRVIEMAGMP